MGGTPAGMSASRASTFLHASSASGLAVLGSCEQYPSRGVPGSPARKPPSAERPAIIPPTPPSDPPSRASTPEGSRPSLVQSLAGPATPPSRGEHGNPPSHPPLAEPPSAVPPSVVPPSEPPPAPPSLPLVGQKPAAVTSSSQG